MYKEIYNKLELSKEFLRTKYKRLFEANETLQLGGSNSDDYKHIYNLFIDNKILKKEMYGPMRICEVGTWIGEMTVLFATLAKTCNGKVYAIDWFKGNPEVKYENVVERFDIKKVMEEHLAFCGIDNVEIIKNTSVEASKLFPNEYFNFVYIDANHSYKNVKQDIECWFPKVKIQGFIGGHDYLSHKSVVTAVNECLPNVKNISRNWYYRKEK